MNKMRMREGLELMIPDWSRVTTKNVIILYNVYMHMYDRSYRPTG